MQISQILQKPGKGKVSVNETNSSNSDKGQSYIDKFMNTPQSQRRNLSQHHTPPTPPENLHDRATDNVVVYEETVKPQPNGIVELEFIKPLLADRITLTIIPDTTPNATPVVKSVIAEACLKGVTTGQPATTPTSSPVFTSGTPSTASAPTTGTQAGAPGTSPPLIQTTQPSVTTGPASTTAGLEKCPDDAPKGLLNLEKAQPNGIVELEFIKPLLADSITLTIIPDIQLLMPPSCVTTGQPATTLHRLRCLPQEHLLQRQPQLQVLKLEPPGTSPPLIQTTQPSVTTGPASTTAGTFIHSFGYVFQQAQPNGIVELEFIKPLLADSITLTIIPDTTPNATPVVKSVVVEACIKGVTTGQPAITPTSSPVLTSEHLLQRQPQLQVLKLEPQEQVHFLIQTTQPSVTTGPASQLQIRQRVKNGIRTNSGFYNNASRE
ncbi:unnamed protein product [Mytilus coruscus]|uniref:Uncharacterized protein n=1 Tax=Mytilus coruscus TaxID=42192 RepID=A0A6J8A7L5_MYTCO|nr:unnamed protein product [Mytilus coruscus]